MESLLRQFETPAREWRGVPFWSWNGKLDNDELIRQIRIFKEMGFGGFFMHSRIGLETPYLGQEWFDGVRVCTEEAEKLGLSAWAYDEDRWPSGSAGGIVTKEDRYRCLELVMQIGRRPESSSGEEFHQLAVYRGVLQDNLLKSYRRVASGEAESCPAEGEECYLFFGWQYTARSGRFNGSSYLNVLNKEAVGEFLRVTHEQYAKTIGQYFGQVVPGIFTDEPCLIPLDVKTSGFPWDADIPVLFRQKYGYDLLDFLPEIFLEIPEGASRPRAQYWELCTALFCENYGRQLGEWCTKHQVAFTGHLLLEDDLNSQAFCAGACMRFYRHMQIPGIDVLTEHWNIFQTAKQCTSVARQLGRQRRLSELYGCTGWDFPFEGHKALGDWHAALGINLRCHHLSWYTMGGYAKRDFPASISFHSPWYPAYAHVEDYFARIFTVIGAGAEKRELLVIHPMESVWFAAPVARIDTPVPAAITALNDQWLRVTNTLLENQLDFDYGDEQLLAELGAADGRVFRVGQATYSTILIPQLVSIRSTTLRLLADFQKQGGAVFYLGKPPVYVDFLPSDVAQTTYSAFVALQKEEDLVPALERTARLFQAVNPADGKLAETLLFHLSETDQETALFICNVSTPFVNDTKAAPRAVERTIAYDKLELCLKAHRRAHLYELSPDSGKIREIPFTYSGGEYHFCSSFCRLESRLFLCSDQDEGRTTEFPEPDGSDAAAGKRILLPSPSGFTCSEPNVLVLDCADVAINGESVGEGLNVLEADDKVRNYLGLEIRNNGLCQPWAQDKERAFSVAVTETFHFSCPQELPAEPLTLVLEQPELHTVAINGCQLDGKTTGYWVDPALRCLEIPASCLRPGPNSCTVCSQYTPAHRGLEPLYILGKFGVAGEKGEAICGFPQKLEFGDWCRQGLLCYGGNVTYQFPLNQLSGYSRVELEIPQWAGCALGIRLNGQEYSAIVGWPPYRAAIPLQSLKHDGHDLLEITVFGHRRNCFGPAFNRDKWPYLTNPVNFKVMEQSQRQTVTVGLLQAPVLHCQ